MFFHHNNADINHFQYILINYAYNDIHLNLSTKKTIDFLAWLPNGNHSIQLIQRFYDLNSAHLDLCRKCAILTLTFVDRLHMFNMLEYMHADSENLTIHFHMSIR